MKKYLELAKKLMLLAATGIGGEKINAARQLDRLMKKYGITKQDLETEQTDWAEFIVKFSDQPLFYQVVASVVGSKGEMMNDQKRKTRFLLCCTKLQEVEMRAKWEFFKRAYARQQKVFFYAFLTKNELYDPAAEFKGSMDEAELSTVRDALILSGGMRKEEYHKQLA